MAISFLEIQDLYYWILAAIALTVLYSLPLWPFDLSRRLRRLGFIKTGLLAFTWAYVTVIVPAAMHDLEIEENTLLLLAARFFFMLMLCSIFDQRDSKLDKLKGLHSLATDVSYKTLQVIMLVSFAGYMAAGILVRESLQNNLQVVAFCVTGALVWWVYKLSLKKQGYSFYYFIVDGLMLISALLSFLALKVSSL